MKEKKLLCALTAIALISSNISAMTSSAAKIVDGGLVGGGIVGDDSMGKEYFYDCYRYIDYGDHAEIVYCYEETEGDLVIPDKIEGLPVTAIATEAFVNCELLTSIVVPDTVTELGTSVFSHCTALKEVDLPDTIVNIPNWTFLECDSLEHIKLHPGIEFIGHEAFAGCESLTSIYLPEGINAIRWGAFMRCYNLEEINFPDSLSVVSSESLKTTKWYENQPDGVVYAGHNTCGYKGEMPENTHIDIREGTTSVGGGTFFDQPNLTSVTFPDSLTHIGGVAFGSCTGLTEVEFPDSLIYLGDGAFSNCTGITEIAIPNGFEEMKADVFMGCTKLSKVSLPNTIRYFGYGVFDSTAYYDSFPKGAVYTGKYLYGYKGKMPDHTTLNIKSGTVGVVDGALYNHPELLSVNFPGSLLFIGSTAFAACSSILYADIPEGVERVGNSAFSNCSSLIAVAFENPACEIYDEGQTVCNIRSEHIEYKFSGYIRGMAGSTAEAFAGKYGYEFNPIYEHKILGDSNCDGAVTIADSILVLQYVGNKDKYKITAPGLANSDVCGYDGISPIDALVIQMVSRKMISVKNLPLDSVADIENL